MSGTAQPVEPGPEEQPTTPAAEEQTPSQGSIPASAPAEAEGEGAGTPPPTPAPVEAPKEATTQDWRDKRIATLTRRLREMQERQGAPRPAQPSGIPEEEFNRQVDARARELSVVQEFNRRCDEVALSGRGQYGETEFNGRIANLQKLVDNSDPTSVQAYNNMLMAALDTGEAARLLHELGADLNEAQRILALPPTRMAVELTKRAVAPVPQVSTAPKPIQPIGSRGAAHERITPDDPDRADNLSTAEWMRRREQQLADRRNNR